MCDQACIEFGIKHIKIEHVYDKKVIEVGSLDINGTVKNHVKSLSPSLYLGCDIQAGPGVDIFCDVNELAMIIPEESFALCISTEMLEHVKDWRGAINNMKTIVGEGGHILITTRSMGFSRHNHPYDFWRFEESDMRKIFSDFKIIATEKDIYAPGIFIYAQKPENWKPLILSGIEVSSVA